MKSLLVMAVNVPRWNDWTDRRAARDRTRAESSHPVHAEIKGHVA